MKMFRTNGLLTCINNADLKGRVFVSITIGAGFSSSWIFDGKEGQFVGAATAKVFFNYLKVLVKEKYAREITCTVSMNSTSIYWESSEDHYLRETETVLNEITNPFIDETLFYSEKKETIERFKTNYKNLEFRGRMKMLEFSHKNRDFEFDHLAEDLLKVSVKQADLMREYLLIPDNFFLFFHGKSDTESLKNMNITTLMPKKVKYLFNKPNYYFLQDEFLAVESKGDYQCGCIKFERLPQESDLTKEYTVLNILAEIMFNGDYTLDVDLMDASITYYKHPLKTYKHEILKGVNKEKVESAKENLLKRMDMSAAHHSEEFTERAGRLFLNKVNIFEWKELLAEMDYQSIKEFFNLRDYQIREGQLSYYKEDREDGII